MLSCIFIGRKLRRLPICHMFAFKYNGYRLVSEVEAFYIEETITGIFNLPWRSHWGNAAQVPPPQSPPPPGHGSP